MLAGSVLAWARPALADCSDRSHLSTCFDADNAWPHPGPGYFGFVGGTTTTLPRMVGLGLFATYLSSPVVLAVPSSDPNGAEVVAVRHLVDTTLLFSLGLTDRLDAGIALPVAVYRSGYGVSALSSQHAAPLARTAMRDARLGSTLRLLGCPNPMQCEKPHGLAARVELSLPTGDESSFAGDRSLVVSPSVSGALRSSPFVAGAELGARIRRTADLAGTRVGPQLQVAMAFGVEFWEDAKLAFLVEAMALPTFVAQHELSFDTASGERVISGTRPALVPAEWQAGFRSADLFGDGVSVLLEGGGPIGFSESNVTAPRFRLTFAVRYAPAAPHAKPSAAPP